MNKVLVFPQDPNPYQELLYNDMRKIGVTVEYLCSSVTSHTMKLLLLIPQLIYFRLKGYNILHLHWLYSFRFPFSNFIFSNYITRLFFSIYFLVFILSIKLLGYQLVWTVHNILPHRKQFISDLLLTKILSILATKKIVHSQSTIDEMKNINLNINNIYIIPMGRYDIYDNNISKLNARKKLNIKSNIFIYLFLGLIEPYKGVDTLINVFKSINLENTMLIIAGYCNDEMLKNVISQNIQPNIKLFLKFIPNKDIQIFFNAADIVVCPYVKITSSSTVNLALGFKKPIIFPNIGNLKDLPSNIGFKYQTKLIPDLSTALVKAHSERLKLNVYQQNGYKYSESLSWEEIALKTKRVLNK